MTDLTQLWLNFYQQRALLGATVNQTRNFDPNLFLSVYLLLYPVLQWGIGGWLLAAPERTNEDNGRKAQQVSDCKEAERENAGLLVNGESVTDPDTEEEETCGNGLEEGRGPQTVAEPQRQRQQQPALLSSTISKALSKAFQPPVVGALLGLVIASFPALRGLFVDIKMRSGRAPLQWFFDGVYAVRMVVVLSLSVC